MEIGGGGVAAGVGEPREGAVEEGREVAAQAPLLPPQLQRRLPLDYFSPSPYEG